MLVVCLIIIMRKLNYVTYMHISAIEVRPLFCISVVMLSGTCTCTTMSSCTSSIKNIMECGSLQAIMHRNYIVLQIIVVVVLTSLISDISTGRHCTEKIKNINRTLPQPFQNTYQESSPPADKRYWSS